MLNFVKRALAGFGRDPSHLAVKSADQPPDATATRTEAELARALVAHLYQPTSETDISIALQRAGFDANAYYRHHPDLQAAFPNADRAALHFLAMVKDERRGFPLRLRRTAVAAMADLPVADSALKLALLASLGNAASDMGPFPDVQKLERFWPTLAVLGRRGARPYIVVGDSHSTFYRRSTVRETDFLLPLHICCTGGSATGLANPGSRSGYRQNIQAVATLTGYLTQGTSIPILIQFGQVDLEFVHSFRRIRDASYGFDATDYERFIHSVVDRYISFLSATFPASRRGQVHLMGVFPPALSDAALKRGYVNSQIAELDDAVDVARLSDGVSRLEWPTLVQRTAFHALFNSLLQSRAEREAFGFASDFAALVNGGDVLDPCYIPYGKGTEHHLDMAPTEGVLAGRVWAIVDRSGKPTWPTNLPPNTREERLARGITFADLSEEVDPDRLPLLDRPGPPPGPLSPQQMQWRREGVVELKSFLPPDLIEAYVARRGVEVGPAGWVMPTPYLHVPELRALALYPPLMDMLQHLIGEPMMLHLALTGWTSTERDWHQDDYLNPPFVNGWYAAVWMALDTVRPESGPFEYLPGSHRWPLLRMEKVKSFLTDEELELRSPGSDAYDWPKYAEEFVTPAVNAKIAETALPVRQFIGQTGDVLVWHGKLMHRGSRPSLPGTERRSLITHYSGIKHRPDMPDRATDQTAGGTYAVFDHAFK